MNFTFGNKIQVYVCNFLFNEVKRLFNDGFQFAKKLLKYKDTS